MKRISYLSVFIFLLVIFNSCNDELFEDPYPSELVKGFYVVNYGNYGSGGASISKFDYETGSMSNFYYKSQNGGIELLSNIQQAYFYNDSVFLIAHEPDQLITVNPLFEQTQNAVSENIAKPRFCIASGAYLYISCWGENPDWSLMPDSYIAKFNIHSGTVESTIPLPGGPEGLEVVGNNLYAALNYKDSVAVINLTSNQVSYIETPAVTSYFVKDNSNNLYVTLVSTYADFSNETGIGYINTSTNLLEESYSIRNVSSGYGTIISKNADASKIYLITSSYDELWNLTGAVSEFDMASKTFASENLINDISGISGLAVNPIDDNIYVFAAESVTGIGLMKIFSASGEFIDEHEVGAAPVGGLFLN
ncbi:MAG: hypothetical protein JW833_12165 [Prolixibacteraceae bacterium]|nr:hypothetical protein [Prolixibacteraceae bacterium]